MIRWPCIVAVAALLCALFTVVTSASAECSWLLCQEVPAGSGRWSLDEGKVIAFQTKAACETRLKARVHAFLDEAERAQKGSRP
jgi:hypothetical protein